MVRNNLMTFDSSRLLDDFIGFDSFFRDIESTITSKQSQSFPPYDIYTEDVKVCSEEVNEASCVTENHTFIKFALAGIPKEDVRVKFNDNILNVFNERKKDEDLLPNNRKNIRLGIAQRNFNITKTISKDLELVKCKMEDGCLIIEFRNKDKVEKGVEFIEIL